MNNEKTGKLIQQLRKEKKLTQKQLADLLLVSDKAISKWERGVGYPDISLLNQLANILEVDSARILTGDLTPNDMDGGNMKKIKFYVCPDCGNTLVVTGDSDLSCCGRKLSPLPSKQSDEAHQIEISEVENDLYLTFSHAMEKDHYITFVAYVCYDRVLLVKLYPEQSSEVRFPMMQRGKLYYHCSKHGLFQK